MTTKNQIVQIICIIKIMKIPLAKSSIQNGLSNRCNERVGVGVGELKRL